MNRNMPPDISIVIVSYNVRQLLLDCLTSIEQKHDDVSVQTIVVDNVSSDGTVSAVRQQFPTVEVIANTANVYFSVGNNQGLAQAQGRYVLVLNPDTRLRGNVLAQLLTALEADSSIGAATTMLYFPNGKLQHNGSRFTTLSYLLIQYSLLGKLFPQLKHRANAWLWYADWRRDTQRDIDVLPGSCIIASRELWQRIGGFDARMRMYFSDDFFSREVQRLGLRTVYVPSDGIFHYEGQSAKQVSARMLRLYFQDLFAYTRLVWGPVAALGLAIALLPTYIVQRWRAH